MDNYTTEELWRELDKRFYHDAEVTQSIIDETISENIDLKDEIKALKVIIDIKSKRIQDLMNRLEKRTEKVDKLNNKIDKVKEKIENVRIFGLRSGKTLIATLLNEVLDILEGEDYE